jgi:predicted nucleotidyltransferase
MQKTITKTQILEYLSTNKDRIHREYGVVQIGLYGSFVRNEQNDSSDIDIAIELEKDKKNIHNFFGVKRELESAFGRKVDLGIKSSLKPEAKKFIERDIQYV